MPAQSKLLGAFVLACCLASQVNSASAQDVAKSPPFPPSQIRPTLLDFVTGMPVSYKMQVMATPKLMRPPFANQPLDSAKGLAYKIKAQQVDVKHRIKAVRYLGEQDCLDANSAVPGKPPQPSEATAVLVKTMQEDPAEIVRLEAVQALEAQMQRGPCGKMKRGRYENCLGCCNEVVLKAVSARAYDLDANGCPIEPSERVRQAAVHLLQLCCSNSPQYPTELQNNGEQQLQEEAIPTPAPLPPVPPEPQATRSPETQAAIESLLGVAP